MARLEDLARGASVKGILPDGLVTVVDVQWHGSAVVELVYKDAAGRLTGDFTFDFEGQPLTSRPVHLNGAPLNVGEPWVGPRPGIPYVLAAGAGDIYYDTPALTDDNPPQIRPSMTRRVQLSKVLSDRALVRRAVQPVAGVRGHQGGRFYVNEHGAMFTPVDAGDGNGIDYIYYGQIDRAAWFPEPSAS